MSLWEWEYTVDLNDMPPEEALARPLYTGERDSAAVVIHAVKGGSPVLLSGSVSAFAARADGVTIALNGTMENGAARVVLAQECMQVPGPLSLLIRLRDGNTVATLLCLRAVVVQGSTGSELTPRETVPVTEDLLAMVFSLDAACARAESVLNGAQQRLYFEAGLPRAVDFAARYVVMESGVLKTTEGVFNRLMQLEPCVCTQPLTFEVPAGYQLQWYQEESGEPVRVGESWRRVCTVPAGKSFRLVMRRSSQIRDEVADPAAWVPLITVTCMETRIRAQAERLAQVEDALQLPFDRRGYVRASDGMAVNNDQYLRTAYIPCALLHEARLSGIVSGNTVSCAAFYDEKLTHLGSINNVSGSRVITRSEMPQGAAFVRFSTGLLQEEPTARLSFHSRPAFSEGITPRPQMGFAAAQGVSSRAPANSAAAYALAGREGWTHVWAAPCRRSADGTWFVADEADLGGMVPESMTDEALTGIRLSRTAPGGGCRLADFSDEERRIPTLERVVQLCLRWGLRLFLPLGPMPESTENAQDAEKWHSLIALLKGYGLREIVFCGSEAALRVLRSLWPQAECCPDSGTVEGMGWTLCQAAGLTQVQLAERHRAGARVVATTDGPADEETAERLACWGVDVLLNTNCFALKEENRLWR